jgi:hypothetical protein
MYRQSCDSKIDEVVYGRALLVESQSCKLHGCVGNADACSYVRVIYLLAGFTTY